MVAERKERERGKKRKENSAGEETLSSLPFEYLNVPLQPPFSPPLLLFFTFFSSPPSFHFPQVRIYVPSFKIWEPAVCVLGRLCPECKGEKKLLDVEGGKAS